MECAKLLGLKIFGSGMQCIYTWANNCSFLSLFILKWIIYLSSHWFIYLKNIVKWNHWQTAGQVLPVCGDTYIYIYILQSSLYKKITGWSGNFSTRTFFRRIHFGECCRGRERNDCRENWEQSFLLEFLPISISLLAAVLQDNLCHLLYSKTFKHVL